jgi:putative hydrolase of the HAD superfamily
MLDTERRNIKLFGYGAKGMCLSMIETAIALTGSASAPPTSIGSSSSARASSPIRSKLLPGVRAAVEAVARAAWC